jgi:hypothetical protein
MGAASIDESPRQPALLGCASRNAVPRQEGVMRRVSAAVLSLVILPVAGLAAEPGPSQQELRTAVSKALPLLSKAAEGHVSKRTCFACHNQALPLLALTTARDHGFALRPEDVKKQTDFIADFLGKNRDNYKQGRGQGGQVDTAGYALFALAVGERAPDATTEAVAEYLLLRDKDRNHWRAVSKRPPSEASDFTTTFLAMRGLHKWGTPAQKERIAKRIDAARDWLLAAKPRDTEDRVFRLWALLEAGADEEDVWIAAQELQNTQRKDGGWSQTDSLDSDAYATGSALVALQRAGGLATSDPAYRRGLAFLLKSQLPDGSWRVHSRSRPFQTYYESGFPHGKDQFISAAASGWATTALALACTPKPRGNGHDEVGQGVGPGGNPGRAVAGSGGPGK